MKKTPFDVDRDSIIRLRDRATKLVRIANEDPKASLYKHGWADGYLRAVEHVLEMENE